MSKFKGTPGKWVVGQNGEILSDAGYIVCNIDLVHGNDYDLDAFAAVPDLLEALQETVKDLVAYQVNALHAAKTNNRWEGCAEAVQPSIDAANAAIAKAMGQQPL